jgi:hypothetical protein
MLLSKGELARSNRWRKEVGGRLPLCLALKLLFLLLQLKRILDVGVHDLLAFGRIPYVMLHRGVIF